MQRNILAKIFIILLLNFLFISKSLANYTSNSILESEYSEYMSNLKNKIHNSWIAPDNIEEGHASAIFRINKNGEIISVEIKESSGNEIFDNSIMEALNKAEPFGNFPEGSARNTLTIQYNFDTRLVKTDTLKEYAKKADELLNKDNKKALEYINLAIEEADDNYSAYFLYARRAKINNALGNIENAKQDIEKSKILKNLYNNKKIESCRKIAEEDNTAYSYFILAHAYDTANEYDNAIIAIDKAINLTLLNNNYKRYREEIIERRNSHF